MDKQLWVLCPICNNKTRTKVREDTELIKFPLFCPKCKTETLINMRRQMADSLEDKPFPALPEDLQRRCWFEFGSAEDHLKYRTAVQKAYPMAITPFLRAATTCNIKSATRRALPRC